MARLVLQLGLELLPVAARGARRRRRCSRRSIELTVVRRLFDAPRVILFVATLGVTQLMILLELLLPDARRASSTSPPRSRRSSRWRDPRARRAHPRARRSCRWSRSRSPGSWLAPGTARAIRAVGRESRCRGASPGVSPRRMSTLVWTIAGGFAALTAVLVGPFQIGAGAAAGQGSGAGLLLRALAAALIGGMVSLPLALARRRRDRHRRGGALHERDQHAVADQHGAVRAGARARARARPAAGRDDGDEAPGRSRRAPSPSPSTAGRVVGAPHAARRRRRSRSSCSSRSRWSSPSRRASSSTAACCSSRVVALSLTVLTGWAGQLSLGQFGFVGLGAFTTAALHTAGIPFGFGILVGGVRRRASPRS